jgi:hypothetical protein
MSKKHKRKDKMTQPRKREDMVAQLRLLAAAVKMDDETDESYLALDKLFTHIETMVDRELDEYIENLLDDPSVSDDACQAIEQGLEEAGFRLSLLLSQAPDGEVTEGVLIPFAIFFTASIAESSVPTFPTDVPDAIDQIAKRKLIRQTFGLGDAVSTFLDGRLYHIDHVEWQRASAVRRYLKSTAAYLSHLSPTFDPLSPDYRKAIEIEDHPTKSNAVLLMRALCGFVLVPEGEEASEVEERLFVQDEHRLDSIGDILRDELAARGVVDCAIDSTFLSYELWEVPMLGLNLWRRLHLQQMADEGLARLLSTWPSGKPITPVLYASYHGEADVVTEVKLAAYASAADAQSLFSYRWDVVHELETQDDIADTIVSTAKQLMATVVMVDDAFSNRRGSDRDWHSSGRLH